MTLPRSKFNGLRQAGAALLAAMLAVTLVATFTAAALWQQSRSIEVEGAERVRVQSSLILTSALDWARLMLRDDARASGTDHLAEPWAVPLNEVRLASFLAVDKTVSDTGNERDAFLAYQITDLQARLNVTNLVDGNTLSEPALNSFARLFDLLGLPAEQLKTLSTQMLIASRAAVAAPAASTLQTLLMPQRVDQLVWLGLSPDALALLSPYITLLPQRTLVNLNTASAEVIYASTPVLALVDAQKLVAARERNHFRSVTEASQQFGAAAVRFDDKTYSVASRFFEVNGRFRLDQTIVRERSVLQREGMNVRTLWRDRGGV